MKVESGREDQMRQRGEGDLILCNNMADSVKKTPGAPSTDSSSHVWCPLHYLQEEYDQKVALIVLNQPLLPMLEQFKVLWKNAAIRAVADGGINELYKNTKDDIDSYLPDIINGDFDSADPELLELYKTKGCEVRAAADEDFTDLTKYLTTVLDKIKGENRQGCDVRPTPDQDFTDFTKCLKIVLDKIKERNIEVSCIIALGGIGGRFDQTMANTNSMYFARKFSPLPVYLHSPESLACVLWKGRNVIHHKSGFEGKWCGLIPIGCSAATVTTSGLRWNLDHGVLRFNELVSTSNKCLEDAENVTVDTDEEILWTMEIR